MRSIELIVVDLLLLRDDDEGEIYVAHCRYQSLFIIVFNYISTNHTCILFSPMQTTLSHRPQPSELELHNA